MFIWSKSPLSVGLARFGRVIRTPLVVLVVLVGALAMGGLTAAPAAAAVSATAPVVISEVYGGGGNSGAPWSNDFVELYNASTAPVDLGGWSVQYASASGTSWQTTPLAGTIAPGAYYLVAEAAGADTSKPLPTADATGTIPMSGSNGKVALVSAATALTCGATCAGDASVVDLVGYGTANDAAGGHAASGLGNTTSAQRQGSPPVNTADNAADFRAAAPTPRAPAAGGGSGGTGCASTPLPPECVAGTTTIQDLQGSGFRSPLAGATDPVVQRVPGIVTAVRTTGSSKGFWIQEPVRDETRSAASSAVFVFTATPAVAVGDSVLVTGTVKEYYPLASGETVATTANLSTTEVAPTLVTVVSSGNPLPAALTITPTTVPVRYAATPPSGANVEAITALDPTRSAQEFWEAHEGMLVRVDDARVVGPGKPEYDEIYVTTKPDEQRTPRGGTYLAGYDETPAGRLLVMPVSGSVPAANVGDVLTGATIGPVDWSSYGGYTLAATTVGSRQDNGLQQSVASASAADQLSIATYNVENLAPADPSAKYAALGRGVVTNLRSPDVVAVEEIQDNNGATGGDTPDGVVAADQTLTALTAAISAAGGPAYRWAEIDPVDHQDGGQPGGNIRSVFLYNPDRVTLAPGTPGGSLDAVAVAAGPGGTATLSRNPGRVDPTNAAWTASRKPLAAQFLFQGRSVIVVANHFNSKGGDQSADGRFQPPNRSSEVQRNEQASVLNAFVKQVLAVDAKANIVLAGDFNDYQFSAPITRLTDDSATLTDLITTLPADERYTYVFNGVSQVLDHIFVSKTVTDLSYEVLHLNAEFAGQVSDHDPQVVRLRLAAPRPPPAPAGSVDLLPRTLSAGWWALVWVHGWRPGVTLSVSLDGTRPLGTIWVSPFGSGIGLVQVPKGTPVGPHTLVVTAPDGGRTQTTVSVR